MREPGWTAVWLCGAFLLAAGAIVGSQVPVPATAPAEGANTDHRLGPLRDLNGIFPFEPNPSREAWRVRSQGLRRQMRVALGLWPWPTRTPLNAVVARKVTREGYTVERVFFESVPGTS